MNTIKTAIEGLVIIEPKVFSDERGYFFESFSQQKFVEEVCNTTFVQDNESKSSYGVLRGLHFQRPPYAQSKLVRVVKGIVWDVAVDISPRLPYFWSIYRCRTYRTKTKDSSLSLVDLPMALWYSAQRLSSNTSVILSMRLLMREVYYGMTLL